MLGKQLDSLGEAKALENGDIESLLYHIMVYYGYRMKFLLESGGSSCFRRSRNRRT